MTTDVLIVGAGPVGLTLAIELARYGVAIRVVDKAAQRTDKSKALVIWSRTLELMERSGCSTALVNAGYKVTSVNVIAGDKSIARMALEHLPCAYPYGLMLPQSETELVLEEFLNGLGVKVERETELLRFTDTQDKVVSILRDAASKEESVESAWIVGCDGAHSTVRHQLGMEFHGETMLIDWVLADIHLEGIPRAPEISIVWHPDGVLAIFPISEDRYRIIADAGSVHDSAAHPTDPTLAEVQAILDKRFPGGARASNPVWLSSFRINERKVENYRAGRAFLAGDAAHVHSPAGGQGMNTGMQDACNLAWKLALVVRGIGGKSLLASYSAERSPIAAAVLKVTGRATALTMLANPVLQNLRNHAAALVLGLAPVRKFAADMVSEISIGYPESPLNAPVAHGDPAPGHRAPIRSNEPAVGAGDTPRFVLFADTEGIPAGLLERFGEILEPVARPPFAADGLWLLRPDGYTALTAKRGDWDAVESYLDAITMKFGA